MRQEHIILIAHFLAVFSIQKMEYIIGPIVSDGQVVIVWKNNFGRKSRPIFCAS